MPLEKKILKEKVMKHIHFINLTNGIEAIEDYDLTDYQFIRLQSSQVESHCWEKILLNIDDNFLMNLALGNACHIYDYSANKDMPRALYQGIAFLEFVLERRWFGRKSPMVMRHLVVGDAFYDDIYENVIRKNKDVKKKLDYFKKFLNTDNLNIIKHFGKTEIDGKYDEYRKILLKNE